MLILNTVENITTKCLSSFYLPINSVLGDKIASIHKGSVVWW